MSWLDILRKILCPKIEKNPKEDYFNNKYPKRNLTYHREELDGHYEIDLRNFIQPYDHRLPKLKSETDDEKALEALNWVIKNIKYVSDSSGYNKAEFWAYSYQTLQHEFGDCEDGAILLYNILLSAGVPYWKLRLSAGWVKSGASKEGHAYLTYYCEESDKWVVLDWCYWPNKAKIKDRPDYKDEGNYLSVWFSWNQKYCFSAGLNTSAKELIDGI